MEPCSTMTVRTNPEVNIWGRNSHSCFALKKTFKRKVEQDKKYQVINLDQRRKISSLNGEKKEFMEALNCLCRKLTVKLCK